MILGRIGRIVTQLSRIWIRKKAGLKYDYLRIHQKNIHMKNLEMLKEKATILSNEEMNGVQGGMKWTNDRSGNVYDVRYLDGWLKRQRTLSANVILFGYER